jgi:hypothetical protein
VPFGHLRFLRHELSITELVEYLDNVHGREVDINIIPTQTQQLPTSQASPNQDMNHRIPRSAIARIQQTLELQAKLERYIVEAWRQNLE